MICPQTKAECGLGCDSLESCQRQLAPYEFCDAVTIGSNGEVVTDPCVTSFRVQPTPSGWSLESVTVQKPPKPTMAEIERLVDESEACAALCWGLRRNTKRLDEAGKDYRAARAALLAAIRQYGEV